MKRYLRIDQHKAQHFNVNYGEDFSSPPPFLYSKTINPFPAIQ